MIWKKVARNLHTNICGRMRKKPHHRLTAYGASADTRA